MKRRTKKIVLTWLVAIIVLGLLGRMEKRDQQLARNEYCVNVREGVWPDYAHTYTSECPHAGDH